ncbi:thiamine pyrophosphate-binding protein [Oscillibacter sp.]|uniref:thiamine pyrophosphate-binding protein n=1 Tax=Oscillibacter sp. TaxID=1945593 RepID=UPI0033921438
MSKKLVSELMVDYLERRDVKYVFGLCGHTVIGMLDALSRSTKVTYVSNRHESVASTAADGYARVTHKASVVMCHLGPGLTNVLTGVANAAFDSIPMVVIAGDVPSYYFGKHPHQEVNMHGDATQYKILEPVVKRAWRVDDPEALPDIMDKAFRLAESGRPGPVLIDMPMDMFSREIDDDLWSRTYKDSHITMRPALDPAAAKAIAAKLVEAKNPVLHAGGGILLAQASDELAALAEFLDIPVSRTLMGQGCLSDRHPLMIGQTGFWGMEFTHSLTVNADVILGLGTRFAEADSSSWYQGVTFDPDKTTFLQIDIDPSEIGRNYPVEIGAVGDLKLGLAQILEEVKKLCPQGKSHPELREKIAVAKAAFKKSNEAISNDSRFPMTPQRILKDVEAVFPEDSLIFTDVGWNKNGVAQQFDITVPGSIHHSSGLATMGFGASAVLGGKLAAPDRICLTLTGDGGFGVNPTCLATAVEQGIACTWVVMNNSAFGTIAGLENANYKTKFGTVFQTPDGNAYSPRWADVAKAYGVESVCVGTADEFKGALEQALAANKAGRPFLVEAPMENIVVPTPGCWNINDIYSPTGLVRDGKLVRKENGCYVAPSHSKSHNAK